MLSRSSAREFIAGGIVLGVLGGGGLALLFAYTVPNVWPRWLFFLLWVMALTGTGLPVAYFLNARHDAPDAPEVHVVIRQALWVGILGATLAWLQLGRVATLWVVIGLTGGLVAIEYSIRLRERTQRRLTPARIRPEGPPS